MSGTVIWKDEPEWGGDRLVLVTNEIDSGVYRIPAEQVDYYRRLFKESRLSYLRHPEGAGVKKVGGADACLWLFQLEMGRL